MKSIYNETRLSLAKKKIKTFLCAAILTRKREQKSSQIIFDLFRLELTDTVRNFIYMRQIAVQTHFFHLNFDLL